MTPLGKLVLIGLGILVVGNLLQSKIGLYIIGFAAGIWWLKMLFSK